MSVWPGFPPAGMTAMLIGILIAETLLAVALRNYSHIFLWTLFQVGNIKANFYNICMSCPEKRT